MLVRLKHNWFGPSEPFKIDQHRSVSGQRFRKGDHELPDWMEDMLPSSAVILEGGTPDEEVKEEVNVETLRSFDTLRAEDAALHAKQQEATDNLAKARAAKKAKAAQKKES